MDNKLENLFDTKEVYIRVEYPLLSDTTHHELMFVLEHLDPEKDREFLDALRTMRSDYNAWRGYVGHSLYKLHRTDYNRMRLLIMQISELSNQKEMLQRIKETEILLYLENGPNFISSDNAVWHKLEEDVENGRLLRTNASAQMIIYKILCDKAELEMKLEQAIQQINEMNNQLQNKEEHDRIEYLKTFFNTNAIGFAETYFNSIKNNQNNPTEVTRITCFYIRQKRLSVENDCCNKPLHSFLRDHHYYNKSLNTWNAQIKDAKEEVLKDRDERRRLYNL